VGLEALIRRPPTSEEQQAHAGTAELQGALEAARQQFFATVKDIRPQLHRFCTRMSGSVLDGEDLVQETLAQAFYSFGSLKDARRLEPWLFRIAHNKCLDFLRGEKRQREILVPYDDEALERGPDGTDVPAEPIDEALATLVVGLPPMERACVLLKDVLDYRLAEIADVVDSTLAGVKAALHRGRVKLRQLNRTPPPSTVLDREERRLLDEYLACFNRRDWDELRRLIRADARVEVVGVTEFKLLDVGTPYFRNYSALLWEWKLSLARVDGEPMIVHWKKVGTEWRPHAAVRLWWQGGKVARIKDYVHVDYLLRDAHTEEDETASE